MEPEAVNTLVAEAEKMKEKLLHQFSGKPPKAISHLFSDMSHFFQEEALSKWREDERFDELVDYILYQYEETGGEELWTQVLLDLRLKKDEVRGNKLLDGLYYARAANFWVALKNFKKYPNNHLSAANLSVAKGQVMKVLYEHAFLLENRPENEQNKELVDLVRERIKEIHCEQKSPNK